MYMEIKIGGESCILINGVLHVYQEVPKPHLVVYPMQNLVDVCGYDADNFAVVNNNRRIYRKQGLDWSTINQSRIILNMLCDQHNLYVQTRFGVHQNGSLKPINQEEGIKLFLFYGKVQLGHKDIHELMADDSEISKYGIHVDGVKMSLGINDKSLLAMDTRGCLWIRSDGDLAPMKISQKFKSISVGKTNALAIDTNDNVHLIKFDGKTSILDLSNLPRIKGDVPLPSIPEKVSKVLAKSILKRRQRNKEFNQKQKLQLIKIENNPTDECEIFNMILPAKKVAMALSNQSPELNREPDESVCLLYQQQKPDKAWFIQQERHIDDLTAKDAVYLEIAKNYTRHGDVILNQYLRGNVIKALKSLDEYRRTQAVYPFMTMFKRYDYADDEEILDMVTDKFDHLIMTAPPIKKTVRVIRVEDTKHYKSLTEGDVMVTNSYMSCSLMYGAFSGDEGDSVLSLELPAGTRMLYLGTVSEFPEELEVLLPVGTRIKITSVRHQWYFSFGGGQPVRARTIIGKVVGQSLID